MSNQVQNQNEQKYDLEERTAKFGGRIIRFVKSLLNNSVNDVLIKQIIRSATSIGANYMEADAADSKKDFRYKIGLCKKESKETMHWLRMITEANPGCKENCREHWKEAHELCLIFSKILISSKKKS